MKEFASKIHAFGKALIKALVIARALTSFTIGITEPVELCFIFFSPVLYILHALLSGLSFMLMSLMHLMLTTCRAARPI